MTCSSRVCFPTATSCTPNSKQLDERCISSFLNLLVWLFLNSWWIPGSPSPPAGIFTLYGCRRDFHAVPQWTKCVFFLLGDTPPPRAVGKTFQNRPSRNRPRNLRKNCSSPPQSVGELQIFQIYLADIFLERVCKNKIFGFCLIPQRISWALH